MNLEKVSAMFEETAARRATMEADIEKATAEYKEKQSAVQAAADAGDLDEYIKRNEEAKRAEAAIFVKRAQLKKISAPTVNEIRAAWDDYAQKHEAAQKKRLAAYEKARRDLFKQYAEIIDAQSAAYGAREKCAEWLGRKLDTYDDGDDCGLSLYKLPGTEPLKGLTYHGRIWNNPELVFFCASNVAPEEWENAVFRVIGRHRSI